jgi:hypothetical protein
VRRRTLERAGQRREVGIKNKEGLRFTQNTFSNSPVILPLDLEMDYKFT